MSGKTLHQLRGPHIWYPHQLTVKFWPNSIFNAKYEFSNDNFGKKGYFYGYLGNAYGDKQIMKCEEKISHHSILETFVHISTTM